MCAMWYVQTCTCSTAGEDPSIPPFLGGGGLCLPWDKRTKVPLLLGGIGLLPTCAGYSVDQPAFQFQCCWVCALIVIVSSFPLCNSFLRHWMSVLYPFIDIVPHVLCSLQGVKINIRAGCFLQRIRHSEGRNHSSVGEHKLCLPAQSRAGK